MSLAVTPATFASIPTMVADRPEAAMAHAVQVARRLNARLDVAHVVDGPRGFGPEVATADARGVLRRWRAKDPNQLVVDYHQFVWTEEDDPARDDMFVTSLAEARVEMVVVNSKEGFDGESSGAPMAAAIAWRARVPVLIVGDEDVVDPADGQGRLRRIVAPVGGMRSAQMITESAVWFADSIGDHPVQFVFVNIQPDPTTMVLRPPAVADDSFQFTFRSGSLVDALVAEALERRADAVLLPLGIEVGGGGAILDAALLEELVRKLPMPILTVPVRHRWRPGQSHPPSVRVVQVSARRPKIRGRLTPSRLF